jgi:hypothetical protein
MEINLTNVVYLFVRLSPFIIVGYFILQSLFESSTKGLFYLAGLLMTSIVTILASRNPMFKSTADNLSCKGATLGNGRISYLPLSQTTLMYSFVYAFTIVYKYGSWNMNFGTISTFLILIIADWFGNRDCITIMPNLLATWFIAVVMGIIWTNFLINTGYDILFFQGISDANVCKMNTSNFRCRLKKQ